MVKYGDDTIAAVLFDCCHAEALCFHEPGDFLHGLRPRHLFSFIRLKDPIVVSSPCMRDKKTTVSSILVRPDMTRGSGFLFWSNTNDLDLGKTNRWLNIHGELWFNRWNRKRNENTNDKTGCLLTKEIWKARARQKSPRIFLEADLWKMLKNSTPWVWLEWIEFFSFFQHFSAFWKLMNAHFSKYSC